MTTDYSKVCDIYKYNADGSFPQVPERFLNAFNGNEKKARKRWEKTVKWRKKFKVDEIKEIDGKTVTHSNILNLPNVNFNRIQQFMPQHVYSISKCGYPVLIEKFGQYKFQEIFNNSQGNNAKFSENMIIWHYVYNQEWLWTHFKNDEKSKSISIYDFEGFKIQPVVLTRGLPLFGKLTKILSKYYVERNHKTFLINCSPFFMSVWNAASQLIPKENRGKIKVYLNKDDAHDDLLKEIDEDQLPEEYGGTSPYSLDDSPMQKQLNDFVKNYSA